MSDIGAGYVQIYTGDGKGKTTAALGLALRAAGRGLRTCIVQFMKSQIYGQSILKISPPPFTSNNLENNISGLRNVGRNLIMAGRKILLPPSVVVHP